MTKRCMSYRIWQKNGHCQDIETYVFYGGIGEANN